MLQSEAKINSWYPENTYPALPCSQNNELNGINQLFLRVHLQQNKRRRRESPWLLVEDSRDSQECFASKVLPDKRAATIWPSAPQLGYGHTAEKGEHHCVGSSFKCFVLPGEMYSQFFLLLLLQETATWSRNFPFWVLSLLGRLQTVASISENAVFLSSCSLKRLHSHQPIF